MFFLFLSVLTNAFVLELSYELNPDQALQDHDFTVLNFYDNPKDSIVNIFFHAAEIFEHSQTEV